MRENKDLLFDGIVIEDKARDSHCDRMAKDGIWGDHIELSAMARLYGLNVRVHQADAKPTDLKYQVANDHAPLLQVAFYEQREHFDIVVRGDYDLRLGTPLDRKRLPAPEEH